MTEPEMYEPYIGYVLTEVFDKTVIHGFGRMVFSHASSSMP